MKSGWAIALTAVALATGCASAEEAGTPEPAWFTQRAAALDAQGAPPLTGIPTGTDALTDPAHWEAVAADLELAGAALRANPRSRYEPGDPAADEAEARRALEATRARY